MGLLGRKLRGLQGGLVAFMCPGCNELHHVRVEGEGRPRWSYNGNPDAPTFQPSVLVRTGHYVSGYKQGDPCWCTCDDPEPAFRCKVCHSFVTDGKIRFLGDCTHELAGQTVELPDLSSDA